MFANHFPSQKALRKNVAAACSITAKQGQTNKDLREVWLAPDRKTLFERKKQYLKISREII